MTRLRAELYALDRLKVHAAIGAVVWITSLALKLHYHRADPCPGTETLSELAGVWWMSLLEYGLTAVFVVGWYMEFAAMFSRGSGSRRNSRTTRAWHIFWVVTISLLVATEVVRKPFECDIGRDVLTVSLVLLAAAAIVRLHYITPKLT